MFIAALVITDRLVTLLTNHLLGKLNFKSVFFCRFSQQHTFKASISFECNDLCTEQGDHVVCEKMIYNLSSFVTLSDILLGVRSFKSM